MGTRKRFRERYFENSSHKKPDDFVLSTGKVFQLENLLKLFSYVNIKIIWVGKGKSEKGINSKNKKVLVEVDQNLYRPLEVDYLCGDSTKAKKLLDWECNISFKEMVKEMVSNDLKRNQISL